MKPESKPQKPLDVPKIIMQAVDLILKESKEKIKAILLFGSHSNGTAIWRSDVDIAVVFKKEPTEKEAFLFRKRLMGKLPDIVDLQVFNVLPLKVRKSIAENHQVLFEAPDFEEVTFTRVNQELFFELKHRLAAIGA